MKYLKLAALLTSLIIFSANTLASGEHAGGHDDDHSTTEQAEKKMKHKMKHKEERMEHGQGDMHHGEGKMHHGKGMMGHGDGEMHHGKGMMKHGEGEMHHGKGHWMAPPAEARRQNPVERSPGSIAQGKKLYGQYCASCHGADAEGDGPVAAALNPKPTNLKMMSGHHPDGDFAWKIKNGRGAMPAWDETLNDTQVWHVVNYIQSLK